MLLVRDEDVVLLLVAPLVLGGELVDGILAYGLGKLLPVEVGPVEAVRVDYGLGGGAGCVVALAPGWVGEDGVGEGDALEGGGGLFFLVFGDLVCVNDRNISIKLFKRIKERVWRIDVPGWVLSEALR